MVIWLVNPLWAFGVTMLLFAHRGNVQATAHATFMYCCHFIVILYVFCYTRWQHLYNFLFCQICCRTICKEENSLLLEQYFVSVRCEFAVGIANAIPAVVGRCRLTVSTMTATALKGASGECIVYSEIKQLDGDNNNGWRLFYVPSLKKKSIWKAGHWQHRIHARNSYA